MVEHVRRMGIAVGSLVAAALCVGLLTSLMPPFASTFPVVGFSLALFLPGPSPEGAILSAVVTIVFGGLIYRDILVREQPRHRR
jgi:hypothetical protein